MLLKILKINRIFGSPEAVSAVFAGVLTNLNFKVSEDGCNCNFDGRRSRPRDEYRCGQRGEDFPREGLSRAGPALRIFEPVYEESAYYGDRFPVGGRYFQPGRIVPDDEPLQTDGQELRGGFQSGPVRQE